MAKPKHELDLIGFSEKLYDVYKVGDPDLVMAFLEKHQATLIFHSLMIKAVKQFHFEDSRQLILNFEGPKFDFKVPDALAPL